MRLFDGPKRDMGRKWWPGSCLKDAFVCGWAQSCIRIPSTPEIDGFIPPMTPIWKNDALMHVYWELETLGSRRELRWYELTTWLFIFYFIFIYFRGFFFFVFGLDTTCDRKKIEGKCQNMQQLFILHDVPAKWQMATFLGEPTKWERRS